MLGDMERRRRTRWIALAVGAALLIGAVIMARVPLQRQLIYHPDRSPAGQGADLVPGAEDVVLHTDDGLELDAWLLPPTGKDRSVAVLVAPGNGGNRAGRAPLGEALAAEGFTVLLMDYRGYGGNPGRPSEQGLARDARAGAMFLSERGFDATCTLYVGESLGTGVATGLAEDHPPAGLVLRSPFTSLVEVAAVQFPVLPVDAILVDRFPVREPLAVSDVPVVVLAGTEDEIVPVDQSRQVAESAGSLHRVEIVDGAGHNDPLWSGPLVAEHTADLADAVIGPACHAE